MLSRGTKSSLHSINIRDAFTKVLPLCSLYQVLCYEPNLSLLAPLHKELAYFSMLFILEVVCTAGSADHLKNK